MAEVTDNNGQQGGQGGAAPADMVRRPRWPKWKIALAYLVLAGVAFGSVWVIDEHVMAATDSPQAKAVRP
jgi:hypothetical protein